MGVVVGVTWDGAGNFPPTRAVVRELAMRGHDLHILGFGSQAEAIAADGAVFHEIEGIIQLRSTDRDSDKDRAWIIENIALAEGYGTSLQRAIRNLKPDVVLVDFFLTAALRTGVASGIPTVAHVHTIYAPIRTTPLAPLIEACSSVHIFSYRQLDNSGSYPKHYHFYAPYSGTIGPAAGNRSRPQIVVSLSTSFQNQGDLIQRLCDAVAPMDADVLVTIGGAFEALEFKVGANTALARFVAHDEVLPNADLLISHAGHGTVMAGARHGVPMICIPMGRDQPVVAAEAERLGICKVAPPDAPVDDLRRVISTALRDQELRNTSTLFAKSVADAPDVEAAANDVEKLMESSITAAGA